MVYDLLRDYQKKAVQNVLESLKTSNATCLIQAPNTGKTLEALSIAEILKEKGFLHKSCGNLNKL